MPHLQAETEDANKAKSIARTEKQKRIQYYMNKVLSIEDYLYLPSHVTAPRREEMLKKYGKLCYRVDHDFQIVARHLAQEM